MKGRKRKRAVKKKGKRQIEKHLRETIKMSGGAIVRCRQFRVEVETHRRFGVSQSARRADAALGVLVSRL